MHLVKAKHKEIALHSENAMKETSVECFNCGSRNVFLLGFVPSRKDQYIVILCRETCANNMRDENWDVENWQALIENK